MKIFEFDNIPVAFEFDFSRENVSLGITVIFLSFLVFVFSLGYIKQQKAYYFLWLSVFILSMLGFVFSENLVLTFAFWEGLGFASYFLVRFYRSHEAEDEAQKVFIFNRLADLAFFLLLAIAFYSAQTFNIRELTRVLQNDENLSLFLLSLAVCCFGKSAQALFFPWLKAAMAGPTTVSSLLHSATMVGAGAILFYKFRELVTAEFATAIYYIAVGTSLLCSLSAITSKEAKQLLAYSTISNLSLLFAVALYQPGVFLKMFISHAFYKCGAFLYVALKSLKSKSTYFSELKKSNFNIVDLFLLVTFSLGLMSFPPFGVGLFKPDYYLTLIGSFFTVLYGYGFFRKLVQRINDSFIPNLFYLVVLILSVLSLFYPLIYVTSVSWLGKSLALFVFGVVVYEVILVRFSSLDIASSIEQALYFLGQKIIFFVSNTARGLRSALEIVIGSFQDTLKILGGSYQILSMQTYRVLFGVFLFVWLMLLYLGS
ncbi:MAG: hypothetical protein NZT61_04465 [Deltaproteobacteria bacterium]|nr:hypothetical protein [Deltaproteobacteria bacterium]